MFVMFDYVKKLTVKKSCKYGEYGLLEHICFALLLLLVFCVDVMFGTKNIFFVFSPQLTIVSLHTVSILALLYHQIAPITRARSSCCTLEI